MKLSLRHFIGIGILTCLAFITLLCSYWSLEGIWFNKPTSKDEIIFHTTQDTYKSGELVHGLFSVCKKNLIRPTIQWALVDTYLRIYPAHEASTGKIQCYENTDFEIEKIPMGIPLGSYYFSGTLIYQMNPIRKIIVPLKTNKFMVE